MRAVDRASGLRPVACRARSERLSSGRNYIIRPCWYMLDFHEQPDGSSPSLGRDRPRKSHGNVVAETGDRREGDARADLPETRLPGAEPFARERADYLRPAGRAEVPDQR